MQNISLMHDEQVWELLKHNSMWIDRKWRFDSTMHAV